MSEISISSLVVNPKYAKQLGLPSHYYRYRGCNTQINNRTQKSVIGFAPYEQYQKQKLIQNTVRVPSSLYIANLAPLSAYKPAILSPDEGLYGVNWNQMSDRPVAGIQLSGGKGCDIKNNSYIRYLNRLKGKGVLRRGAVNDTFGNSIEFNRSSPIYGGKTLKTNIVSGHNCTLNKTCSEQNAIIYNNPFWQPYPTSKVGFEVGDFVYAIKGGNTYYNKAVVLEIDENDIYTIQFEDESIQTNTVHELRVYFPCKYIPTKLITEEDNDCKLTDYSLNLLYMMNSET